MDHLQFCLEAKQSIPKAVLPGTQKIPQFDEPLSFKFADYDTTPSYYFDQIVCLGKGVHEKTYLLSVLKGKVTKFGFIKSGADMLSLPGGAIYLDGRTITASLRLALVTHDIPWVGEDYLNGYIYCPVDGDKIHTYECDYIHGLLYLSFTEILEMKNRIDPLVFEILEAGRYTEDTFRCPRCKHVKHRSLLSAGMTCKACEKVLMRRS